MKNLFLAAILFTAACAPTYHHNASKDLSIQEAHFGVYVEHDDSPRVDFIPTSVVPNTPNQKFGWMIMLKTDKKSVHYKEVLTLPRAPKTWNTIDADGKKLPFGPSLSNDRKTATAEKDVSLEGGPLVMGGVWGIAPGDPDGPHTMDVTIDGLLKHRFTFEVKKGAKIPAIH